MLSRSLRPATRALPRTSISRAVVQRRWASEDSHKPDDAHGAHESHEPNPAEIAGPTEETFFNSYWRNIAILSVLGYGCYAFWPRTKEGETAWLTEQLGSYNKNSEAFENLQRRMSFASLQSEHKKDADDTPRPVIHRFRYKHSFEQASPYLIPVGSQANVDHVRIKTREDNLRLRVKRTKTEADSSPK